MLTPPPDTVETLICGLGLVLGFMGCLLGTVLMITGRRMLSIRRCRSPRSLWAKGGSHGEQVGEERRGRKQRKREEIEKQEFGEVGEQM